MDEKEAEKKRSLRNEKLKANRTSETEEQRKERLRIRREKERKTTRISAWLFLKDCSGERVGEKTKTGDSYQTARETDEKRKTSLEKMV